MSETNINAEFDVDAADFKTAGLIPQGMYKWHVDSVLPGKQKDFETQEEVPVIIARLRAVATGVYIDGELGEIAELDPPKFRTHYFKTRGSAQQQLLTLYQSVTGRVPTGKADEKTGRFVVNQLDLAKEVVSGEAWNHLKHFRPDGKEDVFEVLGRKFKRQCPQKFSFSNGAKADERDRESEE
ncbi:MAG: hypothetical protein ACRD2L_01480 [Terriglobia bacterium]